MRNGPRHGAMLAAVIAISWITGPVSAQAIGPGHDEASRHTDNLPHPLGIRQNGLREAALRGVLRGRARAHGPNQVVEVGRGQYVELARQGEDRIWTVAGEFGAADHVLFPFLNSGIPGPLHNEIPEPDRTVDNTTIWAPDFSSGYYETLLFSEAPGAVSMRNFYLEQSSNRYTVSGIVEEWVQVPYTASVYGRNWCGDIVCGTTTWWFIRDTVNAWYDSRIAAGLTPAEIDAYLSQFDVWDRYDYDHDGDFNEPDGYIDHFQAIHAGEGEETGGGVLGGDALWSHRWYVQLTPIGAGGPQGLGGVRIGDSSYWIGDYTIEPENGGVGVFAHEYGHDLGLPDLYDTSGNVGGGENSTGFWTLYSSGSYGSSGRPEDGIGSQPIPMSAYEKIFLGWSNYQVVDYGATATVRLGPASANTRHAQALALLLPDKVVSTPIGDPFAGSQQYFSGRGDNLDNGMTRRIEVPADGSVLHAKVAYEIENHWDYAYLTVNGVPVPTNRSSGTNPNGTNLGHGITGSTGGSWVDLSADLSAWAGQTIVIGFRYRTDLAVTGAGLRVDEIVIDAVLADGAEAPTTWLLAGFVQAGNSSDSEHFNAYFAEFRNYRGYDDGLRSGPYNFGFGDNPQLFNWVEHFPYQDGLLVWYYDTSFGDNNVAAHCAAGRCGGMVLPVDAHPDLLLRPDGGQVWRPRMQSYDATFGLEATDPVCLHLNSIEGCFGGLPANPVFDDRNDYWVPPDASIGHLGWAGVAVPKTGTSIRVITTSTLGSFMQVIVNR